MSKIPHDSKVEKALQGKESLFDHELCASEKAMEAAAKKVHGKGLRDIHEYYEVSDPTKLSVMFWNILYLLISSNSVTLPKKMDCERKLQLCALSLRHTPALSDLTGMTL